jgi:hypothetical protein
MSYCLLQELLLRKSTETIFLRSKTTAGVRIYPGILKAYTAESRFIASEHRLERKLFLLCL